MQMMYEQQKETLESASTELTIICAQLEVRYEAKHLALVVAEAKLMAEQGLANAWIADMWKELAMMDEEKFQQIL